VPWDRPESKAAVQIGLYRPNAVNQWGDWRLKCSLGREYGRLTTREGHKGYVVDCS